MALRWYMVFIIVCAVFIIGCMSEKEITPNTPMTTLSPLSLTPTPPVTTPPLQVILEGSKVVPKNEQKNWEFLFSAGHRISVEFVTDGAPVDFLVLDASNYSIFSVAFSSRSGKLWDEYIVLKTASTGEKLEFKAPRSANYRIIIENADVIPSGAVTTRDVSVTIRVVALD